VAGRALIQEEHGVFEADGVGIVDLGEKIARVCELGFEGALDFFTHGIAAGADSRADSGDEILGAGAEVEAQAANAALHDARDGASPAGVKGRNNPATAVGDEDGDTVSRHDGKEQARLIGHQAVRLPWLIAFRIVRIGAKNDVRVDLFDREEGDGGTAGHRLGQQLAVSGYGIALVIGGKSKIQFSLGGSCGVGTADATEAGTESVR